MGIQPPPAEPFRPDFSEGAETGLYLALLELIDEGLILTSDETILEANTAACRLLERDYRDLIRQPLATLFPSDKEFLQARARWFIQGQSRGSIRIALPGGRSRLFRFIAAARLRPGLHAILFSPDLIGEVYRDVAHTDAFWPRLAAAVPQPVVVLDDAGRIAALNDAARAFFPAARQEWLLQPLTHFAAVSWPEEGEAPLARIKGLGEAPVRARVLEGPQLGWRVLVFERLPRFAPATISPARSAPPLDPLAVALRESPAESFALQLEPLVDLQQRRLAGAHARLVWNHPATAGLAPERLTELARRAQAVPQLTRYALARLPKLAARIPGRLTLTLAAEALRDPEFPPAVETALAAGIRPEALEFALDLPACAALDTEAAATLLALSRRGIRWIAAGLDEAALPLEQLARLPWSGVMLPAAWVAGLGRDERLEALVGGTVSLAQAMHLEVRAQGVATAEQRDFLTALGVRLQQGPWFGPAVTSGEPLHVKGMD
ncbi:MULTISPECIES: EAL domain-containing protein [Tepidiphilus]|uniref:EAL domain-containing protein n=1 Tax=Tepidiphilus TaxID=203470 RepID=UPI00115E5FB4|nr:MULTISPECIES: EAL domain-containing protein [Tepidiphilus]